MKFKIFPFPEDRPWFYYVKVASSRENMYRMFKRDGVKTEVRPAKGVCVHALCHSYELWLYKTKKLAMKHDKRRGRRSPELGTIYFHPASCTPEIVAHECMHAALSLAREVGFKKKIFSNVDCEEIIVEAHGKMVQQIHEQIKVR